jgi:hypothetical protein
MFDNFKLTSYIGSIISIIALFTPALFHSDSSHYTFIWMIGFFVQLYPSDINKGPIRETISLSMGFLVFLILVIFTIVLIIRTKMNFKGPSTCLSLGILENLLVWSYYIGINLYSNYYRWGFGESYAFIIYFPGPGIFIPSLIGFFFVIGFFLPKIKPIKS